MAVYEMMHEQVVQQSVPAISASNQINSLRCLSPIIEPFEAQMSLPEEMGRLSLRAQGSPHYYSELRYLQSPTAKGQFWSRM